TLNAPVSAVSARFRLARRIFSQFLKRRRAAVLRFTSRSSIRPVRLQQLRFEEMRPDDQLYQARVRSGREFVAPLDPQRHLFACTTKLRRDGEDQEIGVRFIWALGNG